MTYQELKSIIKELARDIKVTREGFKNSQRAGEIDYKLLWKLQKLVYNFRHHHIAASLIRGKQYEQIEKPREGNEPNWDYIESIREGVHVEEPIVYLNAE